MGAARRLYVYVVSAVSLLALATGVGTLLTTLFTEVEDALGRSSMGGWDVSREQLSLSVALIAVGLPLWGFHWWLATRGIRADGPQGDEERRSAVRGWYLAIVAAVSGAVLLVASTTLVALVLTRLLGGDRGDSWSGALAAVVVALPVWAIHVRMRVGELRRARMAGAAAWVTRLYRYGATFTGALVLAFGAAGLIGTVLSLLVGRPDFGPGDTWWRNAVAGDAAAILAGSVAWLVHWRDASGTIRDAEAIGEDDRQTRLRAVYFGAVLVVMAGLVAFAVASAAADLGRWVLGSVSGDALRFLELVVAPPIAAIPFAVIAWWHVTFRAREADGMSARDAIDARRLGYLLVGLVGLAFLTAGSAQLIGLGLESAVVAGFGSTLTDWNAERQVPWHLAQTLVGLVLWLPSWAAIARARDADPVAERSATAARAHLFLVVGAAVVAMVPTATYVLYRLLDALLGGPSGRTLLTEVSLPIGVAIVALVTGVYHARILVADLRQPGLAPEPGAEPAAEPEAPATSVAELELTVPAGTDVGALVRRLRAGLPPGSTLALTPPSGPGSPRPVAH